MQLEHSEASDAADELDDGPLQLGGSSTNTDVKVVVRVRPPVSHEQQQGAHMCVEHVGYNSMILRTPTEAHSMMFNWVAGQTTTQSEFFKVVGRPTVESCLSGFNSCIFAYGQTGSGKTHTMIGELPRETDALPPDAGLIPRIFQYLWRRMPEVQASMLEHSASKAATAAAVQASSDDAECLDDQTSCSGSSSGSTTGPSLTWLVRCSMLEIHKEEIFDLLRPNSGSLNLREDIRKGVYVEGLVEKVVDNVQSLLAVLRTGIEVRQTAGTEYNTASSRSHCIFTCHVESRLEAQPGLVNVRSSRLHLVDLAGSERLRYGQGGMGQGESSGQLLRETTAINTSLSVLGLVILRLTENQAHIPYRNSKLTFLLQDSIGGNAKTIIIANISPTEQCLQETLSTLKFATRARKLVNKAVINEDTNGDAAVLRFENKRLKQELALARDLIRAGGPGSAAGQLAAEEQLQEQQAQLQQALCLLSELDGRATELQEALEYSKTERAELEKRCLEDRQEIAALHVTLNQKEKEARSWRHKWFKLDKVAQSSRSSIDPACSTHIEAASLQQHNNKPEAPLQLGHSRQANSSQTLLEMRQASEVLSHLGAHLSQLVSCVCPAAAEVPTATDKPEQAVAPRSINAAGRLRESLSDLTAMCRPRLQQVPELVGILNSLELLSDWQQRLSTPEPACDTEADCQHAVPGAVSGIPKASFVPIELHRQLEEERQLTAQLQKQVRKLQQQLGIVTEKSSSAVSKSCSSIMCHSNAAAAVAAANTDSPLHTEFCTSADSVLRRSTVAVQPALAQQPQEQQPVMLQLRINVTDTAAGAADASTRPTLGAESSSTETAAGKIAALQQQVAALQEQLEVVTRQNNSLQGRMATARNALAAARCSTPSSLNSSRLPSPQPCFSPLRPLFGESIDEEEEDATALAGPSSWHRHPSASGPGSPSTPVKQIAPAGSQEAVQAGKADDESFSQDELWQQHHSEWQLHQQELQKRQQLTRAVHAAIKGAAGQQQQHEHHTSSLSPSGKPPLSPVRPMLAAQGTSAERKRGGNSQAGALADQNTSSSRSSLELLLQQQTPPRLQLPQRWGTDIRASSGGLATFIRSYRLELQQLLQEADGDVPAQKRQQRVPETAVEPAAAEGGEWNSVQSPSAPGVSAGEGVHSCGSRSSSGNGLSPAPFPTTDTIAHADDPAASSGGDAASELAAIAEASNIDIQDDTIGSTQQQQPAEEHGCPAWGVADYEDEFRQLRQQLEELVVANSSLKAALQQRDSALADKEDLLEQQGHELVCAQELLQEIQLRLSLSEAQRAAAVAEHCDAIWAKGQVAGLRELNEQLQLQLEVQGQEVAELKAALDRFMSTEAEPAAAEAFAAAAAAALVEEEHLGDVNTSSKDKGRLTGQAVTPAAGPGAAEKAAEDNSQAGLVPPAAHREPVGLEQEPLFSVGQHQQHGAANNETATLQETADFDAATPAVLANFVAGLVAGSGQQDGMAVAAANADMSSAQEAPGQDATALLVHTAAATSDDPALFSGADSALLVPGVQDIEVPAEAPAASAIKGSSQQQPAQAGAAQSLSVAKKLRIHTNQLSAQPSNLEIAAEQAILLRHQLEAVGLQLQQKQLEAKLAQVNMQMDRLQQHQKVQLQQQQLQLQRYQRHSAHLQQEVLNCTTPKKQMLWHGGIDAGGLLSGLRAVTTGARLRPGQYNTWSPGRSPARSPVRTFLLLKQSPVGQGGSTAVGPAALDTPTPAAAAPRTGITPAASHALTAADSNRAGTAAAIEQVSMSASGGCSSDSITGGKHATLQADKCHVHTAKQITSADLGSGVTAEQRRRHSGDKAIDTATAAAPAAADAGSDRVEPATAPNAAQHTIQAEDSRSSCSSRCSDGSDSSSLGQCQEELTDLLAQLHALARDTHETSTFKAASASTLTPFASKTAAAGRGKGCWPSGSAIQMQTKLQVSSAFDLEATRGLMHAGAALLELQNELNTAEKLHRNRDRGKQKHARETSPLARSLLSKFNVAVPEEGTAAEDSAAEADADSQPAFGVAAAGVGGTPATASSYHTAVTAEQQQIQSQEKLLSVLATLAQQQEHLMQLLSGPTDSPASAMSEQRAACDTQSNNKGHRVPITGLQQVHQQLLAELREAKAALLESKTPPPAQQPQVQRPGDRPQSGRHGQQQQQATTQQGHGSSSSLSMDVAHDSAALAELEGGVDTPKAELSAAAAPANTAAAGVGRAGSVSGSKSPTRRQRSKQRELLRISQESLQHQQGSSLKSDQQLLRDSCKEERLQQLIQGAKPTDQVLDGADVASSWDASCHLERQELQPAAAAERTAGDIRSKGRAPPALQLHVDVPDHDAEAATTEIDQQEPALVLELRGQIAKLQLQLHELKLRAQVAEGLRHKALQHLPRSHSSCSSRGETESTDGAAFLRSSVDGAMASLSGTVQRPPVLPPGLLSPRTASAGGGLATASVSGSSSFAGSGALGSPGSSTATAATSAAAAAAAVAATPNAVFALTGKVQYLQSRCLAQHNQITHLKDQLQRQELLLRQQQLPPAAFTAMSPVAGVPSGSSTARGLNGSGSSSMFSPKTGAPAGSGGVGVLSPRVGQSSGGSGFFSPRVMSTPIRPQPGEQYSGPSSPGAGGVDGCSGASPTKAAKSPLGVMAMATGGVRAGEGSRLSSSSGGSRDRWLSHIGLDAVPEYGAVQKKVNAGSNRRQSLGSSTAKGLRVALPGGGRMRLAAVKGSLRRQSMG